MAGIIVFTLIGFGLGIPVLMAVRSGKRLTWATAVLMGTLLTGISLILIGEVPSRILYYFDQRHSEWADKVGWLAFMKGDLYRIPRDIVANTVQGIFFVLICVLVWIWGQRHRKAGKFKT